MAQADLLEQMYNMLHELNMVARDEPLVYPKVESAANTQEIIDPDKFPINRLSGDLVKEYDHLWASKKGKAMLREVERYVGHTLEVK